MTDAGQPRTDNPTTEVDPLDEFGDVADDQVLVEDIASIKGALLRYRVMAYVVGVLLVVLVLIGMPLKYIWNDGRVVTWTGVPHGWLYMILIITAFDLGRRVKWSWTRLVGIALAGTVPFLSFVAEHFATKNVRQTIAEVEERGL
ncbi:DUF3817 domain-containing protein [Propionibacteriaceae bacterium Y1923]